MSDYEDYDDSMFDDGSEPPVDEVRVEAIDEIKEIFRINEDRVFFSRQIEIWLIISGEKRGQNHRIKWDHGPQRVHLFASGFIKALTSREEGLVVLPSLCVVQPVKKKGFGGSFR